MSNLESQKFDSFGKEWWDAKGRFASLHKINPLRFNYFAGKIGELKGKRVLDIGCGGGILSEEFVKKGALVTGIDLSPVALDAAKSHAKESGLEIDYRLTSPAQLAVSLGTDFKSVPVFDIVICAEVLEHVDDLAGFLKDCCGLLKKEGYFLFSTINKTVSAKFFAIFIAENFNMVPKGTHDYNRFIRPSTLVNILSQNDVTVEDIKGMTFDPLGFEFKISDNTNINYLGYGRKRA
ncbi:MAG: bifunctional 2-polyprenyl-6-hydroxyphenol methylase/3-demethylubiquinol 3-O-methyltransferase UbiG [Deltaproteobacteria bacterium]|nr:bifunctional 2-polyprenyl-6-hydroxyphenol methylase/3-demethylubiquinol 3-O-methyltransferase UbiG [Deltaproteobacteria bacterium]